MRRKRVCERGLGECGRGIVSAAGSRGGSRGLGHVWVCRSVCLCRCGSGRLDGLCREGARRACRLAVCRRDRSAVADRRKTSLSCRSSTSSPSSSLVSGARGCGFVAVSVSAVVRLLWLLRAARGAV